MPNPMPTILLVLAAINGWTMLRFWQDKAYARSGARRIPEADLLGLAAIGGTPGALLARRLFRHKTRKEPFSTRLLLIAALQAGALIGLGYACH
ncbi:MAG: cold-shock protein [Alphaproteobacteria bacterium]|nr:cold-shock protein [Alphaproteobacteria bacterium]